ncbi:MAG: hypothetical protein KY468_09405 [Armatimonadetes bacterium]|nr:hypothetical protein [Armatimonadota bacterium]
MADDRLERNEEENDGAIRIVGADAADTLPGDEVSVVNDPDIIEETDNRGIMERILDTVLHDENEYIDEKAGPSL